MPSCCNDCRPQILDYLYGLLDAPEAAIVEEHLASCPACEAVRTEAMRVQGLIGQAARVSFPAVCFEPPMPKPRPVPVATRPATVPFPGNGPRRTAAHSADSTRSSSTTLGRLLPWAIAAAILLALPGTIVPVVGWFKQAETARQEAVAAAERAEIAERAVAKATDVAAQVRQTAQVNFLAARQTHDGILAKWVADEKTAAEGFATRTLTWDVLKPAAVQPGAPNEFLLVVRDRGATPTGQVIAEFRDQTDAVLHAQPIDHERRSEHAIRLPASAWAKLKPQDELFLVVSRVDEKTHEKTPLQDKVRLLGPVYSTMLTTDKPTYRPGETARFRSLTLDRGTFTPPAYEQVLHYELRGPGGHLVRSAGGTASTAEGGTNLVRIVDGHVTPVLGPDGKPLRGVGTGEFEIPAESPDGDYTLVMHERPHPAGNPLAVPFPVTRKIKVQSHAIDSYFKQTGYAAASYSAGNTVSAWAELKFQDKPVAGAEVAAVAVADGQTLNITNIQPAQTDPNGRVQLRFALPSALEQGDVRLKVTFRTQRDNKAIEEVVASRVPVVGRNIVIEFFPEGGELVAGVPCRVYFRATTPTGHPVDVTGAITDGRRVLARVNSATDANEPGANRGIGAFTFTPELGLPVWLSLESPAGAFAPILLPRKDRFPIVAAAVAGTATVTASRTGFPLPDAKIEGVVMTVPEAVTSPGQPIRVRLWSVGQARNLVVGAYVRGRLADTQRISVEPGRAEEVRLMPANDLRGGVVRITVFEEPEEIAGEPKADLKPVAERLVFRRPGESLNFNFTTESRTSEGGTDSPVKLNIAATDENGKPAAAVIYAATVNAAVAPTPSDRLLTTHFLLAGEVTEPDAMEHADFLLTDHPLAAESLDRVLATQGWRRFAEQVPQGYARRPAAPDTQRANLLVSNGQFMTTAEPAPLREHRRLRELYWPRYEQAVQSLDKAREAVKAAEADRTSDEKAEQLAKAAKVVRAEAKAIATHAITAQEPVKRFRGAGWYAAGGFALLAVMLAVAAFTRPANRLPFGIGTLGALGIVGFLAFALGMADTTQAAAPAATEHKIRTKAPADLSDRLEIAPEPRIVTDPKKAESEVFPAQADRVQAGGRVFPPATPGRGFPGKFGWGMGGAQALRVEPAFGPKNVVAPSNGILQQRPPGFAPGGMPGAGGGGLAGGLTEPRMKGGVAGGLKPMSEAGWQPNSGRTLIPDQLLAADKEYDLLRRKTFETLPGFGANTHATNANPKTAMLPSVVAPAPGMVVPPAPHQPSHDFAAQQNSDKPRNANTYAYRDALEKAKQYTTDRAASLRNRMTDGIERQTILGEGGAQGTTRGAAQGVTPPPEAAPSFGQMIEFFAHSRVQSAIPTVVPLVVREFALPRPGTQTGSNTYANDFAADTVLWQPLIVLPSDGRTTLEFHAGTAESGYRVTVAGHTLDGRIGAIRGIISIAKASKPALAAPVVPAAPVEPMKR